MKNLLRVVIILSFVLLSIGLFTNNTALSAGPYTAWTDQGIIYTAPTGSAYYPSVIYDPNGFGQSSGPKYKMWYSDGSAAFLVTSSDGLSWSTPNSLTGLNNIHHVRVLYDMNNFGQGSGGPSYRIWYWNINSNLYSITSIYTAQSVDGINWTGASPLSQDPLAQLVTGTWPGWNSGSYGPVHLFYQSGAADTGTDPWNYKYVMYYDGTTGAMEETGLAYSTDGYYWEAYTDNPVLAASPKPAWDSNDAVYGTVYHDSQGFHYWYSGGVSSPNDGIGYAFSTDGEHWTKDPNNPIFSINDGKIYRNARTYTPSVINDGTGSLKMYYTALSTSDNLKKIGLAYLEPKATLTPANGATAVALNARVKAVFDQTVTVVSLAGVTITPNPGGVSATLAGDGVTVNIAHNNFANGKVYTVYIPAGAVQNNDGAANAYISWSFTSILAAPTVTSITPSAGPPAGGTSVTIAGAGFYAGGSSSAVTAVNFGITILNPASYTVNSDNSITATSPAGTGTVDVTVTTAGGTSATSSADKFAYTAATLEVETATNTGMATFTSNGCGGLYDLDAVAESNLPSAALVGEPNLDFKHGFFSFNETVCVPGNTITVTITLPSAVSASAQYWKYGPTPDNNTNHWYQIPFTGAGTNVITITLKDGGLGDDDLTANGVIVDQGGPGNPPQSSSLSVGGIVKFPVDSSHSSSPPYAAIIGGSIAGLAAFAVGFWFVKRRWQGQCS